MSRSLVNTSKKKGLYNCLVFPHISDSYPTREGDYLAMIDPELRKYIEKEGIILTTWREAMQRRQKVK